MTPTDAPPPLLPGISARAWMVIVLVVGWSSVAIVVMSLGGMHVLPSRDGFDPWFYPVFGMITLNYVTFSFWSLRSRKEARAGYTTLWRAQPTLPQLDPVSGAVIRAAGQPYIKKSDWKNGATRGLETSSSVVEKPTLWQRLWPTLAGVIGFVVLGVAVATFGSLAHSVGAVISLTIISGLLALLVIVCAVGVFVNRTRLGRMRTAAPDTFVFLFSSTPALRTEAAAMNWQSETGGTLTARAVSADGVGMTFWQGKPPERAATLPWSRVVSIQADRVQVGSNSFPAVLISYRDVADDLRSLPLANANADLAPVRSMRELRWIASELDALRTGTVTARVI